MAQQDGSKASLNMTSRDEPGRRPSVSGDRVRRTIEQRERFGGSRGVGDFDRMMRLRQETITDLKQHATV